MTSVISEDERIIQIKEAITLFGLTESVWKDACRSGAITASEPRGRRGYSFSVRDARAFAAKWVKDNIKATSQEGDRNE